jgi:predicted dehydrogenase
MPRHRIGVIMNGVTGRMGTNQHLYRSIAAIMKDGGVPLDGGDVLVPDPLLVGRNEDKLRQVAAGAGLPDGALRVSTDLDAALADPRYSIYFDAQTTDRRVDAVSRAIAAGKHVYCEKPTATDTAGALDLWRRAEARGVRHGVVQDKLWLPGIVKLKRLIDGGFFGRILSVRGEFGYWVFEGDRQPPQRPSWNYRKEDGGGIIVDMLCHWRYLLDHVFGRVTAVSCLGATHVPTRWNEQGEPYACTADDAAYATFELDTGVVCHFNSSWCVRVRRDDLLTLQVDGTEGSAVAGLRKCVCQSYANTPRPTWNPDVDQPLNFYDGWTPVDDAPGGYENAFRAEWELFLKYVVNGRPGERFTWDLLEGAKGVQLAELGLKSWRERRWVGVEALANGGR